MNNPRPENDCCLAIIPRNFLSHYPTTVTID
jgi:hypothetical protein